MTANQKNKTLDNSVRADEKSAKFDGSLLDLIQDAEVAWIPLGEVCNIQRGKRLVRSQLTETGKYPVYQNSMTPLGFYDEHNFSGDNTFIICAGAAGEIGYMSDDFWAADDVSVLTTPSNLMSRYLYHFLLTQKSSILSKVRRASVPRLSKIAFEKIPIPVPSLEIQQKVVEILDKMTDYVTELTAELTLRQKQYAYYRDKLLTFPSQSDSDESLSVHWTTLGEIARLKNGSDWKNLETGNIPVYGSGGEMGVTVVKAAYDKPTVLIPRKGSISNLFYLTTPFWNVDTIYYTVIDEEKIVPKFFFYYLRMVNLEALSTNPTRPSLTQAILDKVKIPLPNLTEQKRIVESLDKFDKLTSDLSEGLPREIELRQKQYEYWREQLLSFR